MQTLPSKTSVLTNKLLLLERCGKYEEALAELQDIWEDVNTFPDIENYEPQTAAEVLLRCGSLIGFLGHNKQIRDAQEQSKNLLTEARSRFLCLANIEKVAECENYLALAYWRNGELNEAETWVEESFSRDFRFIDNVRLYTFIIKSLILLAKFDYAEMLSLLKPLESSFLNYGDDCMKGDFYNHCGIAFQELGKKDAALEQFELARFYHRKSRHQIYLGTVENNLAQLYKKEKNFSKSHQAIDNATKIFKKIKDKTREGFSLDTKAQIYFAEKKYAQGLQTVEKAIQILKKGENAAYLTETLLTKVKILIYLDDFSAATLCLSDAVQTAKTQINEKAAKKLVKEFELILRQKSLEPFIEKISENKAGEDNLELVMPPSIAHYKEIQAVRIKNSHLEDAGLKKDSIAIIAHGEIKRGDLIAIAETETNAVSCGFYDTEFGIVCLEGCDNEPRLFDESSVKILGKIIGVCNSKKDADGKMIVEPINITS